MDRLPGKPVSYWIDTSQPSAYPSLAGNLSFDVAVVGGGLFGLTVALLLKQVGRTVAVLEGRRVGEQVSGHTTAKVTAQHGLIYDYLTGAFGEEGARLYADSQQAALERVAALAAGFAADCQFERKPAYLYTIDPARRDTLRHEAETARRLGLTARFVDAAPLPFATAGAVCFDHQAQFHPVRYLRGLAQAIPGEGSQVFEATRVTDIDDSAEPCRVTTDKGVLNAADVVIATNLPILARGGYFAKCFPMRHMMAAARLVPGQPVPDGLFLSADQPSHSLRVAADADGPLLIGVGPAFKTGHDDPWTQMEALLAFLESSFRVDEIRCRWGNQDYSAADRVPYIGRLTADSPHLWTATGFGGWGMTNATLAALIVADLIRGVANPWAALYDSTRLKPAVSAGKLISENAQVATAWVEDKLAPSRGSLDELKPGEGGVVAGKGGKTAAWRDPQGALHAFSATCPHMGCILRWNRAELSWDCPCHGSRFGVSGQVINGPATAALKPLDEI